MKRITTGIVAALAVLSFAVAGCNKDKKDDSGKPGEAPAAGLLGGGGSAKAAATTFAVFPADSEFVLSFSLEALRGSPMWAQLAPMLKAKLDSEMKQVTEACGLDPFAKLTSVMVGGKPGDEKSMVVVVRGFTKDEIASCGAAMAKKDGKEFTLTDENGLTHVKSDGKDAYIAWLDSTTALMSPNTDAAWVKDRAAAKNGLDGNAAFVELLKKVDTSATIWAAGMPAAGSEMDMSKNLPGAKGAFGSLKVSDGLAIDAGLRFDTPANATNANNMATMGLQQAKAMLPPAIQSVVDKTKLAAVANDVTLKLTLTSADLQAIAAAVGPMLGGMMGGMPPK